MAELRMALLGGFSLVVNGREVGPAAFRLRRAQALLKLLGLTAGHRLHRDRVVEWLWPASPPRDGANNLYQAIHAARRALGAAAGALQLRDGVVALGGTDDAPWVDVVAFTAAAAEARRSGEPAAFQAALALYGGDLLPEDRYDDWVVRQVEPLRDLYLGLHRELAELLERRGEPNAAIDLLRRALAHDPAYEPAHLALMRLYAADRQPLRALRQYADLHEAPRAAEQPDRETTSAGEAAALARMCQAVLAGREAEWAAQAAVEEARALLGADAGFAELSLDPGTTLIEARDSTTWLSIGDAGPWRRLARRAARGGQSMRRGDHAAGAVLVVPLPGGLGALGVAAGCLRTWTSADERVLRRLAAQVGQALTRARRVDGLRRRLDEMALLDGATRAFHASLDLDDVLRSIVERAALLLGDAAAVFLPIDDGGLAPLAAYHRPNPADTGRRLRLMQAVRPHVGEGIAGDVFRAGRPLLVTDTRAAGPSVTLADRLGIHSFLALPIVDDGRSIGVLTASMIETPTRLDDRRLALASALAERAAPAIANALRYRSARGLGAPRLHLIA